MHSADRRRARLGRWVPVVFYALIVIGWFADGVAAGAGNRLWLVIWTLPAPALYLWRMRGGLR